METKSELEKLLPEVEDFRKSIDEAWQSTEVQEVLSEEEKHIVISFVGSIGAGKDSGIKSVLGIDTGGISPIPGSTKDVLLYRHPQYPFMIVANTPGIGDVDQSVSGKAKEFFNATDIFLHVINADPGVGLEQKQLYDEIRGNGKPSLVCLNKIDKVRVDERAIIIEDSIEKLGCAESDLIACSFDPQMDDSMTENVNVIQDWWRGRLGSQST